MKSTPMWRRYLRFWGPNVPDDVEDEIQFHLEMRTAELVEKGIGEKEARQEALRKFGNLKQVRKDCQHIGQRIEKTRFRIQTWNQIILDFRFALRRLGKRPVLTAVIVVSLAIGLAANTAVFSLIDAAIFRTLPVDQPEQLTLFKWEAVETPGVRVSGYLDKTDSGLNTSTSFSYPTYRRFHDNPEGFTSIFAFSRVRRLNLRIKERVEIADGIVVSGNYFSGLNIKPALGRLISEEDDRKNSQPVVNISYSYWQRSFGGDPDVTGQVIHINGEPFTIIGVTPQRFNGTLQVGTSPIVYVPISLQVKVMPSGDRLDNARHWWVHVIGRLEPEFSRRAVSDRLNLLMQKGFESELGKPEFKSEEEKRQFEYPKLVLTNGDRGMDEERTELVDSLIVAQVVTGLILLIACINTATLLVSRSESRRKEMAVRLSLGAGRKRLMLQLLTESMILSLIAGIAGFLLSHWGSEVLLTSLVDSSTSQHLLSLRNNHSVFAFALLAAVLTGIIFGLVPAVRTSGLDLTSSLKDTAGVNAASGEKHRLILGKTLVILQVSLTLVLLVIASLFIRSMNNLKAVDPGFDINGVYTFRIDPTLNGYQGDSLRILYDRILEEIETIPTIDEVSVTPYPPISGSGSWIPVETSEKKRIPVNVSTVDVNYLKTLRIPLISGRHLRNTDDHNTPLVALVNETFAMEVFGNQNPVGLRFRKANDSVETEIIGIYRNNKNVSLKSGDHAAILLPYQQSAEELEEMTFLFRTSSNPDLVIKQIRRRIARIDPYLPIFNISTLGKTAESAMFEERLFANLSSICALLAIFLSCIGIYGTVSHGMVRRTQEIGIRMTLGAQRIDINRLVIKELIPIFVGLFIGLIGAWSISGILTSMLFQLNTIDSVSLGAATLLMIITSITAACIPTFKASRIDPLKALRCD